MKKYLSVFISFILLISPVSVVGQAIDFPAAVTVAENQADYNNEEISVEEFSDDISEMVSDYDDIDSSGGAASSSNRLIVKSDEEEIEIFNAVDYVKGYNNLHIVQFDNKEDMESAYEYYETLDYVEYVQEDGVLQAAEIETENTVVYESTLSYPTSLQSNTFGYTNAKANMSTSNTVEVAVVDSGVQNDHEFLAGRISPTGFNSIDENGTCYDDRGHGTQVAGIIAANTKSNVVIKPYKVLNKQGKGTETQVSLGVYAAIEDGVDIINLSLSMQGESEILKEACQAAYDAGIIVIVAAGNAGYDLGTTYYSPGSFDTVFCVAACANNKRIADFSNYGKPCDYAAPGVDILSSYLDNTYKISSGTSVASPFICAAVSYLLAKNPGMSYDEIDTALWDTSYACYGTKNTHYVMPATATTLSGTVANPVLSHNSCTFVGNIDVTLSSSTTGAQILYKTDDSSVYKHYQTPVSITETTTLTAYAIKSGMNNSSAVSVTYTKSNVNADDFVVDENGCLVSYTGSVAELSVPSYINGKRVSSIGDEAFKDNTTLETVTLDSNISSLGNSAFSGCTSLRTFRGEGILTIGDFCFNDCVMLNSVNLPLVTSVPVAAFKNVGAQSSNTVMITLGTVTTIADEGFFGSGVTALTLNKLTTIGAYAFANCVNLNAVNSNALTSLGESAFENCSNLERANYYSITEIPDKCFKGCTKLVNTTFTNVKSVGYEAYSGCSSLTSLSFPSVTELGEKAFEGCSAATSLSFPARMFDNEGSPSSLEMFAGCEKVTSVNVKFMNVKNLSKLFPLLTSFTSSNVGGIPDYAFQGCTNLSYISLPALSSAGDYAFSDTCITSANYPKLENVGAYCFSGIDTLNTVTLPLLTEITSDNATFLSGSNNLTSVTFAGLTKISGGFNLKGRANLTSFTAKVLTNLPANMFKDCTSLNSVALDAVETVGSFAFENCGIKKLVLTKVTSLHQNALANNPNFNHVSLSAITNFDLNVFSGSEENITHLAVSNSYISNNLDNGEEGFSRFPKLETLYYGVPTVETGAVSNCLSLKKLYLQNATVLEDNSINNCPSLINFTGYKLVEINPLAFTGTRNIEILTVDVVTDWAQISNAFNLGALVTLSAYAVQEIPSSCMANKTKLTTVKLNSVKVIPQYAFRGCTSLKSANFSGSTNTVSDYAFQGCSSLTSFSAHGSLKTVGQYAFAGTKLSSITTSTFVYVTTVGAYAFKDCTNLKSVEFRDATRFGTNVFEGCTALTTVTLTSAVSLGDYLFKNCEKLATVNLPAATNLQSTGIFEGCIALKSFSSESVSSIGEAFFKDCTALQTVTLPALEHIPYNCFNGCTLLKTVSASKVKSIGNYGFKDCKTLRVINMASVTDLGEGVFDGCTALTDVLLDSVTSVPAYCFSGCVNLASVGISAATHIYAHAFDGCTSLSEIDITSVEQIGDYAFYNCDSLTSAGSMATTELGEYAFSECDALVTVSFFNVTAIPEGCFMNCPQFVKVGKRVESSIKDIGAYAFKDCPNFDISSIDVELIEKLGSYAFDNIACTDDADVEYDFASLVDADANAFEGLNISVLKLEKIQTLSDLPDCDFIALPRVLQTIDTDTETTATVCVHKQDNGWAYCVKNNINYAVYGSAEAAKTPIDKYNAGYMDYIEYEPIGFNVKYEWYACNNEDYSEAVRLDGLTNYRINPAEYFCEDYAEGKYKYYFCKFTTTEDGTEYTYKSALTKNICATVQGTENTLVDHLEGIVFTDSLSNVNSIENIMSIEEGNVKVVASYEKGKVKSYGTGSEVWFYTDDGEPCMVYRIVVYGDVNGDGVVDVLDSSEISKAVNGHTNLTDLELTAADMSQSATVDAEDYQQIINKVVS